MRLLVIVLITIGSVSALHAQTVLVSEDFEGAAPGTLLNTMPGWSGPDDFVISATTIDQGQSVDCSAGSAGWPKMTQSFSYAPTSEEQYVFSATLWVGGTPNYYAHAQLGIAGQNPRLWVGLGYGELIIGYDGDDGAPVGTATGDYASNAQLRIPMIVDAGDGSIATMDFKLLLAGDGLDGYWKVNGDADWINAGQISGGLDFAGFNQVDLYGHSGYPGNIDTISLIAEALATLTPGDANGDGYVDVSDLGILATHYDSGGGKTWAEADFTGDGVVDVSDLGILATNYGATPPAAVPEPSILALLVLATPALLALRRR